MDAAYWQARLTATQAQIEEVEAAISSILSGAVASYTLDTGQTRQAVTKLNISSLERWLDSLLNRATMISVRLNGTGSRYVRPDF